MTDVDDIDLNDPDLFRRGGHHEVFTRLRHEDPVHWTPEREGTGYWSITRHADLVAANRDTETFSNQVGGVNIYEMGDLPPEFDMRGQMMLTTDPPAHTRYRLLVNKGFTPRMIGRLEPVLAARATQIVDEVIEAGHCEFVTEVAAELPLQAIADIMGVPEDERHRLFDWSNRMVGADDPEYNDSDDLDSRVDAQTAAAELFAYADELGRARTLEPRDDVVTALINAEIDGDRLTTAEFDLFVLLLAVAGNETTRNATANGMHALLTHPDELAALRGDPTLIDGAIEEILRWSTPVLHFRRTATRDVELRGRTIRKGDKVVMWHISANRDEDVFEDPFRFDIRRSPNEHIAFGGGGAHYCLGANLARLELRLIFAEVVSRMVDPQLDGEVERLRSNFINGIKHMPIRYRPGVRSGG